METTASLKSEKIDSPVTITSQKTGIKRNTQPGRLETKFIWWLIKLKLFYLAVITLKNPSNITDALRKTFKIRENLWAGNLKKLHKVDGKYYINQYYPSWPSKRYDDVIKYELRRKISGEGTANLSFVFLAITRKCPMRCEHCFEWDNLNQMESFSKEDLLKVIDIYQQEGVLQFHFSGGEPMVRFKDLIELIKYASLKSECWVLTSGFNLTTSNAMLLKKAGCKGVVVSIDHYIPELHNLFRGNDRSFDHAVAAIHAARAAGLVTSVSVCATKSFLNGNHLLPYLEFAKILGVQFVQVLEPRKVGHYEGRDVMLEDAHIKQLEETFKMVNYSASYHTYPTLLYHGYHQRRIGCFSGSRSVYIDSAGDVHACPFCHTKSYNIIDLIRSNETSLPKKENACPLFNKVV